MQHVSDPKHVTKVTKERLKMEPVSRSQSCRKSVEGDEAEQTAAETPEGFL